MESRKPTLDLAPCQVFYLDLIRAAAAQMVVIGHTVSHFFVAALPIGQILQATGVVLFFLLSGFLICRSVLNRYDRPDYGFHVYLIERFARIFTPYLPALIFVAAVDWASSSTGQFEQQVNFTVANWLGNLLMLQDYPAFQVLRRLGLEEPWFIRPFGSAQPFWTVSIEWWIYFVFGWITLGWLRRRKLGAATAALFLFAAVVPLYHLAAGYGNGLALFWITGATMAVAFSRLTGAGMSLTAAQPGRLGVLIVGVTGLCLAAMGVRLAMNGLVVYDYGYVVLVAGALFAPLVGLAIVRRAPARVLARPVAYVANYSYSLYLIHSTIIMWVAARFDIGEASWSAAVAVFLACNLSGAAFAWLFERHYQKVGATLLQAWVRLRRPPAAARPAGA